jgi:alkylated DNA repair dioxygenase AlkB
LHAVHSDGEKDLGPVVASLSLGSPALMRFRPVPGKYSPPEATDTIRRKTPPIALTLTLRHGDVLIMDGAEIQEYYQVGHLLVCDLQAWS